MPAVRRAFESARVLKADTLRGVWTAEELFQTDVRLFVHARNAYQCSSQAWTSVKSESTMKLHKEECTWSIPTKNV